MKVPDDRGLVRALDVLGIAPDALLGRGGEARVYALDADRIARVHHAGTSHETVTGRTALLRELSASAARIPFAIPSVIDTRVCSLATTKRCSSGAGRSFWRTARRTARCGNDRSSRAAQAVHESRRGVSIRRRRRAPDRARRSARVPERARPRRDRL